MPIPTAITDLSTTAASNYPAGSDSPSVLDDVQRAHAAFIAGLRDDPTANALVATPVTKGGTGATSAAAARTALGVAPRATRIDVASVAGTVDLTTNAPDTDDIRITGSLTVTTFTVAAGRVIRVTAGGAFTLTNSASIVTQTGANIVAASGDTFMLRATSANVVEVLGYAAAAGSGVIPRSHLAGLTLSTAGSSSTMSIAEGQAADSTNAYLMQLAASISKTTSTWAVGSGNGGLDTGTIANNTSYHFFLIRRPDTNVIDVLFSTSATSPTLPTNYTQFRRIGSCRTNGSAQWVKIIQDGNWFQLDVPVLDIDVTGTVSTAVTRTLGSIPTGIRVRANFNYAVYDATNAGQVLAYFSDLSTTDLAPSATVSPLSTSVSFTQSSVGSVNNLDVWTDTSSQIRSRVSQATGTCVLKIATLGWYDPRGQNS